MLLASSSLDSLYNSSSFLNEFSENQKEIARNYISQIDNSLITIQKAYSDLYKSRVDIQNNIF